MAQVCITVKESAARSLLAGMVSGFGKKKATAKKTTKKRTTKRKKR